MKTKAKKPVKTIPLFVHLPADLKDLLVARASDNRRSIKGEIQIAIEKHLGISLLNNSIDKH